MILTPDIIPNNLRTIREMKSKTTEETAKAIGINVSYMSILENAKANMSGRTALKMIHYFDSSFAAMFGQPGIMKLTFTTEEITSQPTKIILTKEEYDCFQEGNIFEAVKLVEKEFKNYNMTGSLHDVKEISSENLEGLDKVLVSVEVTISKPTTNLMEFDMNLTNDINLELYKALREKGFDKGEHFNLNYIEKQLNMSKEEVQKALGLTERGYNQIFEAKKDISVKIMWRLVKLFKVPLEMIMNIPLYMETNL